LTTSKIGKEAPALSRFIPIKIAHAWIGRVDRPNDMLIDIVDLFHTAIGNAFADIIVGAR
jgi:hypothetical protein